jgi:hypothetical protein
VELAEAAAEAGVVDKAAPVLGDERCAGEVDGLRREAQEEFVRQVRRRIGAAAAAGELVHLVWGLGGEMASRVSVSLVVARDQVSSLLRCTSLFVQT